MSLIAEIDRAIAERKPGMTAVQASVVDACVWTAGPPRAGHIPGPDRCIYGWVEIDAARAHALARGYRMISETARSNYFFLLHPVGPS